MPITVVSVGDAKTYHGGLGAAYRIPMSDRWTITPGARYSATVSKDQASIAGLFSGSVASTYVFEQDAFDITVGNMIGYYATQKFTAGDYSFNPGIKNTVLRNGVMLTQPVMALGQAMSVEYSIIDTRYLGTDVFMDNTQEVGVTLGTSKRATSARSYLRAGMSYTHGPSISGFTLKLGYWF